MKERGEECVFGMLCGLALTLPFLSFLSVLQRRKRSCVGVRDRGRVWVKVEGKG